MDKTEFFCLVADYCDAIEKAAQTKQKADENVAQNTFHKIKAICKQYGEQARKKLAMQTLKKELDLKEVKE